MKITIRRKPTDADKHRARVASNNDTNKLRSLVARDIADGWDAVAPSKAERAMRAKCERDLRLFLEHYFPNAFPLAWSPDHLAVIAQIQEVVLNGGLFAIAMPRGSGKTTIIERAALWAMLYGHRRFVCVVGAAEDKASAILNSIKSELQHNDRLARPFREVCYPIRRLEGEPRRANGQLFNGERTAIGWGERKLVLPRIPGSKCSGIPVSVVGITGAVRGQKYTLSDGTIIRPDLCLIDDPQTRESALSDQQCTDRLGTIKGDVLGMAGPGRKIAGLAAVTVIRRDDLADKLLDRQTHPEWQGQRTSAVVKWPDAEDLWTKYLGIRAEGMRRGTGIAAATEFYRANRDAMDAGAVVSWPQRHDPEQLSAVQWAHDTRADVGDEAFASEYQNHPLRVEDEGVQTLTASQIAAKVNAFQRATVPPWASHVTIGIDVGDRVLHWVVAAWADDFTGAIIDYGLYPQQAITTARKAVKTLQDAAPGAGIEGAVRTGVLALVDALATRVWMRTDGAAMRVGRMLVDSAYLTEVIHDACRASPHAAIVMPSRGRGITAKNVPMSHWPKRQGETLGYRWCIRAPAKGRLTRHVETDTHFWKSCVHARLSTPIGDPGALSLWGTDAKQHGPYAAHLVAEYATRVEANGVSVDEWMRRPGGSENHFLDATCYAAVAASMVGASLPGVTATVRKPKRAAVRLEDLPYREL